MHTNGIKNPFKYSTPDQMKDPEEALNLFVDVFKDFNLVESPGNTFVNGARGSGKSMMFRIMQPDCQKIKLDKQKLNQLDYFAVYVPIKDTSLDIQELHYLKGKHGEYILNEHFMCLYFTISILKSLNDEDYSNYGDKHFSEVKNFYQETFKKLLKNTGYSESSNDPDKFDTINDIFSEALTILEKMQNIFSTYIQRLFLEQESLNYSGPLCLYRNFLLPLIKKINEFTFLPPNKPLYLLVDDADLLSHTQTRILNSWVSYRSTSIVCFKVTTQLNYKTYRTTNSLNKIESPHDYHEINLSEVYTSNIKDRYRDNIKAMVEKRLKYIGGLEVSAEDFFPKNEKQEKAVKKLFKKQEEEHGYDYAYRNARMDYMLNLSNKYSYSYSGFNQLVHLSSGIIRNFIDLSFNMFDKASRKKQTDDIKEIPVNIQDEEILDYSNWKLKQLNKSIEDEELPNKRVTKYKQLKRLINSIGKAFRLYLESDSSERRKFSFYYEGEVNEEVKKVLKLGVSEGFFHYSTLGSKSGLGRAHQYVLNRIVSPVFKLDPFSFTGYLYLTPQKIDLAIKDQKRFLGYIKDRINNKDHDHEQQQLDINF